MISVSDFINALAPLIAGIEPSSLLDGGYQILDCREKEELANGVVPGSHWIAPSMIELKVEKLFSDKSEPVVVYCATGTRSVLTAKRLRDIGYSDVRTLIGGITGWKDAGLSLDVPRVLSQDWSRYQAQMNLSEIGEPGQEKLRQAKVLLVGLGGLGSPAAMYLAGAGVGTLGVVDNDVVDQSNLHRQILHSSTFLGLPKTLSATATLRALNPQVKIVAYQEMLGPENIDGIVRDYNLIIDGTDNFRSRYLINEGSLRNKKICIQGAVNGFQGQVAVYGAPNGPCYSCIFPELPPKDLRANCNEAGVLGSVAGVVGCMMATEAVKILLHAGQPLVNAMICFDALENEYRVLPIEKNPECRSCAKETYLVETPDHQSLL